MDFKKLVDLYKNDKIVLNPPYQRNPIWSLKAQKELIATIRSDQPIPNFFFRKLRARKYEMVDGQQRARTVIAYMAGDFTNGDGVLGSKT